MTRFTRLPKKVWDLLNPTEPSTGFLVGFMASAILVFAAGLAIGGHI